MTEQKEIQTPTKELEQNYPYSAIVILPYGSRVGGIAGKKIIPERRADLRLSSYSAMVTEAARVLYQQGMAPHIIALGENTFGEEYFSTASLMKRKLMGKGIPGEVITSVGNLQDTNEQLQALADYKSDLAKNPLYVVMEFHQKRVEGIRKDYNLPGEVKSAEDIFMDYFREKYTSLKETDPQKYQELLKRHERQLKKFTPVKIRIAEFVTRSASGPDALSKTLLKFLRKLRGGPTVTDYHTITSAKKQLEAARKAIGEGKLKSGDVTASNSR